MEELIPFGTRPSQARFTQNSWLFLRSFLILYRFQGSLLSSELVHNTTHLFFCQHFFWNFFTFFAFFFHSLIFQRFVLILRVDFPPFSPLGPFSFSRLAQNSFAVSTLFRWVLTFYCISVPALLKYRLEAFLLPPSHLKHRSFIILFTDSTSHMPSPP